IDVHELVENVVEMVSSDIENKSLELERDLRATRHFADGDPARVQQVLWNLMSNAIEFTPANGQVRIATADGEDGRLRVTVTDSGVGIDPELLQLVFNAFQQGEHVMRQRMGGLGLGLTICRLLVEMHGGELRVESAGRNTGARFTLELPTMDEGPAEASYRKCDSSARRLRLLLVEDHADTARVLARLLERIGHTVRTAGTIAAAREAVKSEPFDVVLCDLGLPDGSGLDLIGEVTKEKSLPAIAMS